MKNKQDKVYLFLATTSLRCLTAKTRNNSFLHKPIDLNHINVSVGLQKYLVVDRTDASAIICYVNWLNVKHFSAWNCLYGPNNTPKPAKIVFLL
jgi:hypothetical protein